MPLRGGIRGGGRGNSGSRVASRGGWVQRGPRGFQEDMADDEPEDPGWEPTGEDGGRKLLPNVHALNRILRHELRDKNLPITRDGCASLA